jgi:hypothetical protein
MGLGGMMFLVPAVIVGGQLVVAVADRPPTVNFEQTCRAAATGELRMDDKFELCVADEKRARDQLGRQWASFNPDARARCTRMSTGHAASYIELLTCLEMDKSAAKRPGHDGTTGLFFTAPERSVTDEAADPGPGRPGPVTPPRQQGVAAVPAPVVTPSTPGPSVSPGPTTLSPPPASPLPPSPTALSAPPASEPPPSQAASEGQALYQSFCRSPFGYVLPNCR